MTKEVESVDKRYKQYQKAKDDGDEMRALLSDAYYYSAPYRNDFYNKTQGQDEMADVFDNRAVDGLVKYATNIQSIMMPAYQQFITLVPGNVLSKKYKDDKETLSKIKEKMQEDTDTFFINLNNSNFYEACHEALQDMCISTGVLMINEGTLQDPFLFSCVPLSQIYFGVNAQKKIVNFFREWQIKPRDIKDNWPDATLTDDLASKLDSAPDDEVFLLESVIEYKDNSPENRYYHCVMTADKKEIFTQFLNYSPFIAFRSNVSPNSNYGIGPIIRLLPTIRFLNRLLEDGVAIIDWQGFPSWMLTSSAIINPYTTVVGSNQTFYVRNDQGDAIKLLQPNAPGAQQILELWVKDSRDLIESTLFLNPLGEPGQTAEQTATEVATRQQNWIRNGGSEFGRLNNELIKPFVKTCFQIMRNLGIIDDIQLSDKTISMEINSESVSINYASPLLAIQNEEDIQNVNTYMQNWAGLYGAEFLTMIMDISEIPTWMAEKQNIPLSFMKPITQIQDSLEKLGQVAQQQMIAQQGGQPGAGGQPQGAGPGPQQLLTPGGGAQGGSSPPQSSPLLP